MSDSPRSISFLLSGRLRMATVIFGAVSLVFMFEMISVSLYLNYLNYSNTQIGDLHASKNRDWRINMASLRGGGVCCLRRGASWITRFRRRPFRWSIGWTSASTSLSSCSPAIIHAFTASASSESTCFHCLLFLSAICSCFGIRFSCGSVSSRACSSRSSYAGWLHFRVDLGSVSSFWFGRVPFDYYLAVISFPVSPSDTCVGFPDKSKCNFYWLSPCQSQYSSSTSYLNSNPSPQCNIWPLWSWVHTVSSSQSFYCCWVRKTSSCWRVRNAGDFWWEAAALL